MLDLPNFIFLAIQNNLKSKMNLYKSLLAAIFALTVQLSIAQTASISGKVIAEGKPIEFATIVLRAHKW